MWLAGGLLALRRLRASSVPAVLDGDLETLAKSIAPAADICWHPDVTRPITFGWRRPAMLLPRRLSGLPLDVQRAAVIHEAIHVARRDWLWLIGEQAVQAVFWFHPAMWFAIDQVQLAREQIVDEAAVDRDRRSSRLPDGAACPSPTDFPRRRWRRPFSAAITSCGESKRSPRVDAHPRGGSRHVESAW